jgi:hypothetical protein
MHMIYDAEGRVIKTIFADGGRADSTAGHQGDGHRGADLGRLVERNGERIAIGVAGF